MAVEKRRLLYEFYILSTKNSPTRSEELVEEIGVSVRTFKSDIEDLKQFAIASGARLESKNGVGYWLEVVDHSIFDPFKEELIEYKENKCILNKEDNIDKYIIKGNDYSKNISLVINITNTKYYKNMINISNNKDVELNLLFNYNDLSNEIDNISNHSNILFKGKSNEELNNFIKILHNEIYCVKTDDFDIKKICSKKKLNSINKVFEIQDNLLNNVKNNIKNGTIFFISENNKNLKELSTTIYFIM